MSLVFKYYFLSLIQKCNFIGYRIIIYRNTFLRINTLCYSLALLTGRHRGMLIKNAVSTEREKTVFSGYLIIENTGGRKRQRSELLIL